MRQLVRRLRHVRYHEKARVAWFRSSSTFEGSPGVRNEKERPREDQLAELESDFQNLMKELSGFDETDDDTSEELEGDVEPPEGWQDRLKPRVLRSAGFHDEWASFQQNDLKVKSKHPIDVPVEMKERLRKALEGRTLSQLGHYHDSLRDRQMRRYQAINEGHLAPPIRYSWKETLAFAAFDLLPLYAVNRRILRDALTLVEEQDRTQYKTMLDFGSGPATATLAAREETELLPNLEEALLVEPSRSMWEVAVQLIHGHVDYKKESIEDILEKYRHEKDHRFGLLWCPSLPKLIQGLQPSQYPTYDVVNCTFALSELPSAQARAVTLGLLWSMVSPGGILVVAERADVASQAIIQDVRNKMLFEHDLMTRMMNRLLKLNPFAYKPRLVAPCPHAQSCPMFNKDGEESSRISRGCFFLQETHRFVTKKGTRGQGLGRRTSPHAYSYVVFQKSTLKGEEAEQHPVLYDLDIAGRLVRNSLKKNKHILLDICATNGEMERVVIPKSVQDKTFYRYTRKSNWGELWGANLEGNDLTKWKNDVQEKRQAWDEELAKKQSSDSKSQKKGQAEEDDTFEFEHFHSTSSKEEEEEEEEIDPDIEWLRQKVEGPKRR